MIRNRILLLLLFVYNSLHVYGQVIYEHEILGENLIAVGIKETNAGQIYSVSNSLNNNSVVITLFQNFGSTIFWSKTYPNAQALDFVVDQNNNLVIAGQSNSRALLFKVNVANGNILFSLSRPSYLRYTRIIENNQSNYVALGDISVNGDIIFLDIFNPNGTNVQTRTYDVQKHVLPYGLCQLNNGDYIIGGGVYHFPNWDQALIRVSSTTNTIVGYRWDMTANINNISVFNGAFDEIINIPGTDSIFAVYSINNNQNGNTTTYGVVELDLSGNNFTIRNSRHFQLPWVEYLRANQLSLNSSGNKLLIGGWIGDSSVVHEISANSLQTISANELAISNFITGAKTNYTTNDSIIFTASQYLASTSQHVLRGGKTKNLLQQTCLKSMTILDTTITYPVPQALSIIQLSQSTFSNNSIIPVSNTPIVKYGCCGPPSIDTVLAEICSGQSYTLPNNSTTSVAGSYVDTLTAAGGCDSIVVTHLNVNPTFNVNVYDSICNNQTYTLPDSTIVSASGIYINTLSTINGCDSIITTYLNVVSSIQITDTINLCDQTIYELASGIKVSTSGTYTSTLISTNGCDSVITTTVQFNSSSASDDTISICSNSYYTLPDSSVVNTSGIYISTIKSSNGCDSVITTRISVVEPPFVNLGKDALLCNNESVTLIVTNPNASYLWNDNSTSGTKYINTIGTYFVEVTIEPCEPVRDTINFFACSCEVFIPNAFSPNGDNRNDIFKPLLNCPISPNDYLFSIYNRWGLKIFETTMQNEGWNGTFKKKNQNIGSFFYLLKIKDIQTGKDLLYKGDVILIR